MYATSEETMSQTLQSKRFRISPVKIRISSGIYHCWVRVVNLNHNIVSKVVNIAALNLFNNQLRSIETIKVLLINAKKLAVFIRIIGGTKRALNSSLMRSYQNQ